MLLLLFLLFAAAADTAEAVAAATDSFIDITPSCGPTGDYIETLCCSTVQEIGYNFPFGCSTRTQFVASTTPSITFDRAVPCFNFSYPSFTAFLGFDILLPQGGVGSYMKTHKGESVRVIEWSGVYNLFPVYAHFGTVQMWLFRDGSIGVLYHLTGQFFLANTFYSNDCVSCKPVVVSNSTEYLRSGEAYIFLPSSSDCAAPFAKTVWHNPPNKCFNPVRTNYTNSTLFIPNEDCSLENWQYPWRSYCADRDFAPNDAYNASGITYKPLKVCEVDQNNNTQFKNSAASLASSFMLSVASVVCLVLVFL